MNIRGFCKEDAAAVSQVVVAALRETNIKDYDAGYIEEFVQDVQPDGILQRAGALHFYVACDGERIVGCGGIGRCEGSEDESILSTIFVLPDRQGKGVGRALVETLERDEYFLHAKRVEVSSSITAEFFYKKLGYTYKFGVPGPNEEGSVWMEKRR